MQNSNKSLSSLPVSNSIKTSTCIFLPRKSLTTWAQFGGGTGDVSPHFFRRGDIICHVPPLFSQGFVFREVLKRKVMLVTFCVKSFSC